MYSLRYKLLNLYWQDKLWMSLLQYFIFIAAINLQMRIFMQYQLIHICSSSFKMS